MPERVNVRHILLKTDGKPASEDAAIKAKAEDLLKQIRGGRGFRRPGEEDTPKTPGRPPRAAISDWIARGQTVPEFEQSGLHAQAGRDQRTGQDAVRLPHHPGAGARAGAFEAFRGGQGRSGHSVEGAAREPDDGEHLGQGPDGACRRTPRIPEKVAADFNMQLVRADLEAWASRSPRSAPAPISARRCRPEEGPGLAAGGFAGQ